MKLRRRAVLKWTGAGLCALIFALWFASRWHVAEVEFYKRVGLSYANISVGRMVLFWDDRYKVVAPPKGLSFRCSASMSTTQAAWDWMPSWSGPPHINYGMLLIPLYVPFVGVALPTGWLFYRDRNRVRWAGASRCVECEYDLSGLPPGAGCPECGMVT